MRVNRRISVKAAGFIVLITTFFIDVTSGQDFYFGNDLSYANMMEDCGAVFKENGKEKDIYEIFANQGSNLVRVRLWHNPTWQNTLEQPDGVKLMYNDYNDAKETIKRAKQAGMQVLLGFQFSDVWTDPSKQIIPAAWSSVANNLEALKDSVYNYVTWVLTDLESENLMPEIVKIGNENNGGILRHATMNEDLTAGNSVSTSWSRHAQLYNKAIQAVRDISKTTTIKPKIALHCAGLSSLTWWYSNIVANGVTDFDIIGFSYYYSWHGGSLSGLGGKIAALKSTYPDKEVWVIETGYLWTTRNFDELPNIIDTPDPQYEPASPINQLRYMVDMVKTVKKNGGTGVVFWEPDWVSTPCRNPWGVGSSQEHVAFFEVNTYNFMENGGGRWANPEFYENEKELVVSFEVDMTGVDVSNGVYITGSFTGADWQILPMYHAGKNSYTYVTAMMPGDTGAYYFLNDSAWSARETVPSDCALSWNTDRKFIVGDSYTNIENLWGKCETEVPTEVTVSFHVDMTGQDVSRGVYITGEMTGLNIDEMTNIGGNIYEKNYILKPGTFYAYYFLTTNSWDDYNQYRETVPTACALLWNTDRRIDIPAKDTIVKHIWGSCEQPVSINLNGIKSDLIISPDPANNRMLVSGIDVGNVSSVKVFSIDSRCYMVDHSAENNNIITINLEGLDNGIYVLYFKNNDVPVFKKFVVKNE